MKLQTQVVSLKDRRVHTAKADFRREDENM